MTENSANRPNVLFVVIDQLRADCLAGGALGDLDPMPNLKALQDEAVSFQNHYSVAAPCGPSRASILTGQYAMNHRSVRNGTPLKADTPNLASEVVKLGYEPLLFGYTDSARDPRGLDPEDPVLFGYEEVMPPFVEVTRQRLEDDRGPWRDHLEAKGYNPPPYPDLYRPTNGEIDGPALYSAEDSDTAFLTDQVIADLAQRPRGWCAHVTYIRPHPPFVAPAPYNRMFAPEDMPEAAQTRDDAPHPFLPPALQKSHVGSVVEGIDGLEASPETTARIRAVYLGLAREVDDHLGRLIAFLKETEQYEDTLIVVTADHGELLGDYDAWGKSHFYDAAFKTPLIIRDPSRKDTHGRVVTQATESIDVTPTILDLLGAEPPHAMDGHSLKPFLEGESPEGWRAHSISELDFGNPVTPTLWQDSLGLTARQANLAVLRTKTHRLVHFGGDLPQILFDMERDGEARNVANEEGNAAICLDLTRKMLCHRMINTEGTFARTMVTSEGVKTGAA